MAVIDNLEALLAEGTDNALLRFGLASEYLKLGQTEQAITHLQHAVVHDPKYSAAWNRLGKALTDSGRTEEAIDAYQSGIRAAEDKGDVQAAREMRVFLKRLQE